MGGTEEANGDRPATAKTVVPPRLRIQSLMWVIGFIAAGLALNRWLYPLLTLVIMVFPAGVLRSPVALSDHSLDCQRVLRPSLRLWLALRCAIPGGLSHGDQCVDQRVLPARSVAWWFLKKRSASTWGALGFATLLHCWLFWFAFPYLGELP
jgi:hypothetical protein